MSQSATGQNNHKPYFCPINFIQSPRVVFHKEVLSASGIYIKPSTYLTPHSLVVFDVLLQVWFQNRRMKDKRQRIAIAWPYAAVYSDPAFAASILQAAANSVGMPYGYPHGGVPQNPLMGQQMPTNRMAYGFPPSVRYNPYPIPIPPQGYSQQQQPSHVALRTESQSSSLGSPLGGGYSQSNGLPHQSPGLVNDHTQLKSPQDLSVSPESHEIRSPTTSSTSSLSPDSDRIKCDFDAERTPVKCNGQSKLSQDDKTSLPMLGDKPNLFRPYKSEV